MPAIISNCRDCFARAECGGWMLPGDGEPLISCFAAFGNAKGLFIDPNRRPEFLRRLAEVKYFAPMHTERFFATNLAGFPDYLTLVQGGVCFNRPLSLNHAALNLVEIFHGDKAQGLGFGRRHLTAESLRAEWGLRPDTELVLSGVANDPELERLWGNYRAVDLANQIANLRVAAVTAPNFTFWKNAPRLENLINRRRMFRVAEALTAKRIAVIPHLNSTHSPDWEWMFEFFSGHTELAAICMEFRTGNRIKTVRQQKVLELARLRDRLGRELQPVIIGNIEAAREMRAHFPRVLAIDSMPALKTVRRQQAVQGVGIGLGWRKQPLAPGDCMSDLFETNFNAHHTHVMARFARPAETPADIEASAKLHRTSRATNQLLQGVLPLEAA